MPWKALKSRGGDTIVTPSEVESGKDVYCIDCGKRLRVWRTHERSDGTVVVRHFKRSNKSGESTSHEGCGGGEGDSHYRAKSILVETLKQFYPDATAVSEYTFNLDWNFDKGKRDADSAVLFDEPHHVFGRGIAVEVQDKHHDKNVLGTTRAYLANEVSVCWLSLDSFGKRSLKYNKEEFENLVRNSHPDSSGVFGSELNPDGTVPNKGMYPLVAPAWPHSVDVARDTRTRVTAGWDYTAYATDQYGSASIQGEPRVVDNLKSMPGREVQLPTEFYQETARRFYRETTWHTLFRQDVWTPRTIKKRFSGVKNRVEVLAKFPLSKWLADSDQAIVIGHPHRSPVYPFIKPKRATNLVELSPSKLAAFVDTESGLKRESNDRILLSRRDPIQGMRDFDVYIPSETMWSVCNWVDLFPGTNEYLPIQKAADDATVPSGTVPFGYWFSKMDEESEILKEIENAYIGGRYDKPGSIKVRQEAMERIPRIIEYNTGGPQPETIHRGTILSIGTQCGLTPAAISYSLARLCANGTLRLGNDGRYTLLDSS